MRLANLIIVVLVWLGASVALVAADARPVMRVDITNDSENKVVDVNTYETTDRLEVSTIGDVQTTPGGIGDLFLLNAQSGGSPDMRVDGSVTPVYFTFPAHATYDSNVLEIRLFLGCVNIKFTQWACKNAPLPVGIEVSIKSDNTVLVMPLITKTEDFKNKFSTAGLFSIDYAAASDQLLAIIRFDNPFIIRKQGYFGAGNDDYIKIKIQDNLTGSTGGNLNEFSSLVLGFYK